MVLIVTLKIDESNCYHYDKGTNESSKITNKIKRCKAPTVFQAKTANHFHIFQNGDIEKNHGPDFHIPI